MTSIPSQSSSRVVAPELRAKRPAAPSKAPSVRANKDLRQSTGNKIMPLVDREDVIPAILETIRSASTSVFVQSFNFGGEVGKQIADALIEKQRQGLTVKVLLDPKLKLVGKDDGGAAVEYLKQNGVDVRSYPTSRLPDSGWLGGRNAIAHSKMVLADGTKAIAGGMNLSDSGAEAHDFMVKIQGPAATQLTEVFMEDWATASRQKLPFSSWFDGLTQTEGESTVAVAETSPKKQNIDKLVVSQLRKAKTSISMSALFLDHPDYIKALVDAKKRGVKVRVILDSSAIKKFAEKLNFEWVKKLPVDTLPNLPAIAKLKEAGIPVHLYQPNGDFTYLHGKLAMIDGKTTLLGSANFTVQAANGNREIMLAIDDPEATARFQQVFERDWTRYSKEVGDLPWWQRAAAPVISKGREKLMGS